MVASYSSEMTDEDFSDSSRYPQAGSRPVTTGGVRPGTGALMPDWMFSEDQAGAAHLSDRPKTGYVKVWQTQNTEHITP